MSRARVKVSERNPTRKNDALLMRAATPLDQPRAIGAARVSSKSTFKGSTIENLRHSGALKLLFPQGRQHLEAIIINTAGGITGGDVFSISAEAGDGSTLTLSTQAAERAYGAQPGQEGQLTTQLNVGANASLYWLPQETILYNQCNLRRRLRADLAQHSRFLMVEPIVFGRQAMGEALHDAVFRDRIEIRRNGKLLYLDGLKLYGDVAAKLGRPATGNGTRAMASVVWVAPEARGALETSRSLIGTAGGASMLQYDVMVMRLLAEDSFELRRVLVPLLENLTKNALPQSWRL